MSRLASSVAFAIFWFIAVALTQGSQAGCSREELDNLMRPGDPAYADAMGLAATLQNHGFTTQCVLPSKFVQFLPGQTGAALFRTTLGDFDILFRPKEQNFDDIVISETTDASLPSGKRYHYVLRDQQGHPLRGADITGRETFFVRYHNIFFVVWQKDTAAVLTEAFQESQ
jgi:hypothetical protein